MKVLFDQHQEEITALCRQFGVRRLQVFGSAARGDFDPDASDIDVLVEFDRTDEPGYADRYLDLALALERLFQRPVDLVTRRSIRNRRLAERVEREAAVLYEG